MYDSNVGKMIKILAVVGFIVGVIVSVITGIRSRSLLVLLLVTICGAIVAWIAALLLYGYGEIIDKLCDIEQNTRGGLSKTKTPEDAERESKEAKKTAGRVLKEAAEKIQREAEKRAKREAQEEINRKLITCPNCYEKLSCEKGSSKMQCPYCDYEFHID